VADPTVLLITADSSLVDLVQEVVDSTPPLSFHCVATYPDACNRLQRPGVVLILAHLPQGGDVADVSHLLRTVAGSPRPAATIILSDEHRPEHALAFLRQGAVDCLDRPLSVPRLSYLIDAHTVRARLEAAREPAPKAPEVAIMGEGNPFLYVPSAPMGRLMEQVERVAPQETTILLGGETGTGKTRLAKLIHEISPRRNEPFLVVNCAALPANLMESEMFGHVRGAFTGADRDRAGKFTDAGRGTILLDEIDALPLTLQAKFLRVVEERTFEAVGANRSLTLQARLIVASNRDLEEEANAGRFRTDLYYRLNVVGFFLPPLRERRDVIRPLVHRLVADFATRNRRSVTGITEEALQALEAYHWPGNIREMRNVIERGVALCPGTEVELADLPEALRQLVEDTRPAPAPSAAAAPLRAGATLAQTKEEAEAAFILAALKRNDNNRLRAALELGISRMTLYKKLHRYGLIGSV
jgi:DNA-binding NtrC family response regulator